LLGGRTRLTAKIELYLIAAARAVRLTRMIPSPEKAEKIQTLLCMGLLIPPYSAYN